MPLRIAAKIPRGEKGYFAQTIEPQLDGNDVQLVGEVDDRAKQEFLANAAALIFPIDWPEPFGLVMIEAMACGTPVLAFRNGSVAEVIDEGVTGFIVDSEEEGVRRLGALLALDRGRVRRRFEERFTASRMAADYVKIYKSLVPASKDRRGLRLVAAPGHGTAAAQDAIRSARGNGPAPVIS